MTDKLLKSFTDMVDSVIAAAPTVLTAVMMLVFGLIVAKVAEKVLRFFLVKVKFDNVVGKAGVDVALQKIGLRQQLSHFIPRLVYFLLLFLIARIAADGLGIQAVSDALSSFFAYLPNLVSAFLLVLIGTTVGPTAGGIVARAAEGSGIDFGPALGRLVSAVIVFITGLMAVAQLKIDTEIIQLVTAFSLAGFALAFGLAFGLGARDTTRNILAGFYARKVLRVGDPIEVRGQHGVLAAVTATHTLIEADGKTISLANTTLLDEVAKQ